MKSVHPFVLVSGLVLAGSVLATAGCEEKKPQSASPAKPAPAATPAPSSTAAHDDHDHKPGDAHAHDHGHDHDHDDGPATPLGEQTAGGFTIKASRDGTIKPGGDAPIDAWVTGGTAKVAAVRFWIGTQDAKGSVKAKAGLEKDNWHTHVEVPSSMPAGSKLWVEVETDKGERVAAGFDLHTK